MSDLPHVTIYSDGACQPNPGPGGWAVLLRFGDHLKTLTGSELQTTNNRMELTAVLEGLQALTQPCRVDFYTDSQYVQRGLTEWLPRWRARNWKRKDGALANADLWQALDTAIQKHTIQWHWVRSHAGNPDNERVDRLAKQSIPAESGG